MEMIPDRFFLPTNFEVKASILKVVEVAYSQEGIDIKAALKKGKVKATLDHEGNVTITGKVNGFKIKGDPTLVALGKEFKALSADFSLAENGNLKYEVMVSCWGAIKFGFSHEVDFEKFVLDRGLIQRAYRGVKNRDQKIQDAIHESLH